MKYIHSHLHRILIIFTLAVFLSGCNFFSQQNSQIPQNKVLLTIIQSRKSTPIPTSFIGMNIEMLDLCSVLHTYSAHHDPYEQLFENLGTGTLYIGGTSADQSVWKPNAPLSCQGQQAVIDKALVNNLFAFVHRIHWNVIWELNFINDNPQMAAAEAAYVSSTGGSNLLGFSLGYAPELYVKQGYRPASWTFNDYLAQWEKDHDIILKASPHAQFIGPDTTVQSSWMQNFLTSVSKNSNLLEASHHYYSYTSISHNVTLSPASLLNPHLMQNFEKGAINWVTTANEFGLPIIISEMNTISNGGILGISNSFAASLWTSSILFESLEAGIHQIDFQETPGAPFSSIDGHAVAQLPYYGQLFFHLATAQSVLLPSILNTAENVSAYVLKGTDATLRVVVINKEPRQGIAIAVQPGASYRKMTILRMQAASLASTNDATIGGTDIGSNGTWTTPALTNSPIAGEQTILNVPASSAALFTFSS
jgi:hypothetical protein